jgi:hypothetical protein
MALPEILNVKQQIGIPDEDVGVILQRTKIYLGTRSGAVG